ncbi:MAG: hypothetical protein ACKOA4_08545 [Haliscomenobacter sp.]
MIRSTVKTVAEIMSRKVLVAHPDHEYLPLCRLFLLMNRLVARGCFTNRFA